jgi:hypothetical protein
MMRLFCTGGKDEEEVEEEKATKEPAKKPADADIYSWSLCA